MHERGARVPSLRRLYEKGPYFTNGSAPTIEDVVRSARFRKAGFVHHATEQVGGEALEEAEIAAVVAFIDLL